MELHYFFLALLIFLMYFVKTSILSREGFEDGSSQTLEEPEEIYDDTYASIYNELWQSNELLKYEQIAIQEGALADRPTTSVRILDMCSGTAPNACYYKNLGVDYLGVDLSQSMIKKARELCPSATFQKGDITQVQLFPPKSFSTALLLNFSIYQFRNPKIVSDNAYQWLQPEGIFVVHLVDPDKYDPLHDLASPFASFSLQKYSLERQTDSEVFFDQFKYKGRLNKKPGEDNATYEETLTYYDPANNKGTKYREHKHHWTMPSKERLIDIIKTSGFRHLETQDLVKVSKEYQYLVFFTK
jgi:ubiquinone/menaquinone biosynthesis C-methylase UbiE